MDTIFEEEIFLILNKIFQVSLIVGISIFAYFLIKKILREYLKKKIESNIGEMDEHEAQLVKRRYTTVSEVILTALKVLLLLLAVVYILQILGLNIVPIIASASILTFAIGFGSQSLIKDTINGLFIVIENQFNVGDTVIIADHRGKVEDFNLRRTLIRDLKGNLHTIPNSEIKVATNVAKDWSRLEVTVSIRRKEDLEKASAIIQSVLDSIIASGEFADVIIDEPKLLGVQSVEFGDIKFKIWGKTKTFKNFKLQREIRKRVMEAFEENKIEIPQNMLYRSEK